MTADQTQPTPGQIEQELIDAYLAQGLQEEAARRAAQAAIDERYRRNNAKIPNLSPQEQERAWMARHSPLRRERNREEFERQRAFSFAVTAANLRRNREAREAADKAAEAVRQLWHERIARAQALFEKGNPAWEEVLRER